MLTLPSNIIFGLWVLVGVCSLVSIILTALLTENLVYHFRKFFKIPGYKEDKTPARKPTALWMTFWSVVTLVILGTAVASVAEPPRLDAILTPSPEPIFTLIQVTTPVHAGDDASIAVQAQPGDACKIRYLTPSGTLSTATGLDDRIADAGGTCTWTWKIASNTKAGAGEITIEVRGFKQNFEIEIVK